MRNLKIAGIVAFAALCLGLRACTHELTPEQKQTVVELKKELATVRQDIDDAEKENGAYSGGLIKSLIAVRLEVLKTNEALVEQRIDALEGGARITVVSNASAPDPTRATEIANDIETQKTKLAESQVEADRYTGGLVKALAETAVATTRNTLALLEQQYLIAHYGIATPVSASLASAPEKSESPVSEQTAQAIPRPEAQSASAAEQCLKIKTFDSSVLSTNDVFTELAWKVDVSNSCAQTFEVRVTFTIYDKDEFELDSDSKEVYVAAHDTGKARGKMLVSPPEKARRMARQGAKLSEL